MRPWQRNALIFCGFLAIAVLVYGSSLRNGFVIWDDDTLVYQNPLVQEFSWRTLKGIFTSYDPELYIPLTLLTYQIEHLLFGLHPLPYHVTNLLLHVLNAVLVVQVIRKLGASEIASILCGLLFLVHPLNAESVAWISARKDVLCATFFLASVLAFLRYREDASISWYFWSIAFALFAMLSKATAVMLPAICILIDVYRGRAFRWKEHFPFALLAGIFFIIAFLGKTENVSFITPLQTFLLSAKSTAFALKMLLWPSGLSSIYQQTGEIALSSAEFFVPLGVSLGISIAAIASFRRRPAFFFAWMWFVLLLLPSFANFAKEGDVYFAGDRYPYLAQVGVLFLVALAIDRLSRRISLRAIAVAAAVPMIAFAMQSHARSLVWGDSETLFRDALEKNASSWEMHYHLGLLAHRRKHSAEAESAYRKALELYPQATIARVNLGILLVESGRVSEGEAALRIAADTDARDASALNALGALLLDRGAIDEAVVLLEEAVRRDPSFLPAYANLGSAYGKQGRYSEGIEALREAGQ